MKIFSIKERAGSFRYAFQGLFRFFGQDHNAWIHMAATIVVLAAAVWFRLSSSEWIAVLAVTGFVWVAEIINTAIEKLTDMVSPGHDPRAGYVKDLAAAAVLIAAVVAAITGAIIFIPKLF